MEEKDKVDEIISKGFLLGIKLSVIYIIIFIIVILAAPEDIATKFATYSLLFAIFLVFGVILHGLIKRLKQKE